MVCNIHHHLYPVLQVATSPLDDLKVCLMRNNEVNIVCVERCRSNARVTDSAIPLTAILYTA